MAAERTILVVDDEPSLCRVLQRVLAQEGYEVLTATSGEEALRIFEKQPIHFILLDLKMPGMGGLEFLKRICGKEPRVSLPVVIMTGYGDLATAREAMSLGVVEYLTKPFDLKELKSIVFTTLGSGLAEEGRDRQLIYVPILHTENDMGTLATAMQDKYVERFGEAAWHEHVEEIDKMWAELKRKILKLKLSYNKVKIYQDGLPVCEKEEEIIAELASKGSPNHKLVQWMMEQGAGLVGTEPPELLLREYDHLKQMLNCKKHEDREKLIHEGEKDSRERLAERDKRIGERINATLKQGETGILFIGLLHRVDEILPSDIKVKYLIRRLQFRRGFEAEAT
jgi:CheY-like chemotaxis protein